MSNYGNEILREIRNRHIESLTEAVDKEVVREIAIFVMNDPRIYRQQIVPIIKNMKRIMTMGDFDKKLAIKQFSYVAKDGIKKFEKEVGSLGIPRGAVGKTELAIGEELLDHFEDEIKEFYSKFNEVYNQVSEENKQTINRMLNGEEYEKIIEFVEET
jgi:hypothetical protein